MEPLIPSVIEIAFNGRRIRRGRQDGKPHKKNANRQKKSSKSNHPISPVLQMPQNAVKKVNGLLRRPDIPGLTHPVLPDISDNLVRAVIGFTIARQGRFFEAFIEFGKAFGDFAVIGVKQ